MIAARLRLEAARTIGCDPMSEDRLRADERAARCRAVHSDAAIDTVRHAREIGIDFLDSSDAYGQGRNEELIARAVMGHRNEYVIATKFGNLRAADGPPTSDGRPEYVRACCERSPKRLAEHGPTLSP